MAKDGTQIGNDGRGGEEAPGATPSRPPHCVETSFGVIKPTHPSERRAEQPIQRHNSPTHQVGDSALDCTSGLGSIPARPHPEILVSALVCVTTGPGNSTFENPVIYACRNTYHMEKAPPPKGGLAVYAGFGIVTYQPLSLAGAPAGPRA